MTVSSEVPATDRASTGPDDELKRDLHRKAVRRILIVNCIRLLVIVLFLMLWQYASGRWIDEFMVSKPTAIWHTWWGWATDGSLWYNARYTLTTALMGFLLGSIFAMALGYLFGTTPWLADTFEPFIAGIYSLPKLALVPLFVIWVGIGRSLAVTIAALVTFFLMFYNTYYGVRDVDRNLVNAVRILGGGRTTIALQVRLPAALVWVVAGLRLSVPQALVGTVVAEILASNHGLGYVVAQSAGTFDTAGTFAGLLTLLVVGILVDRLVSLVSRRSLVWRSPQA